MKLKEAFDVFKETERLNNESKRLNEELENVKREYENLKEICPHEIIFKYCDHLPRKMTVDGNYFCPACRKNMALIYQEQIDSTSFKNSKIISLMNLSVLATDENLNAIRNEVINNLDIYYNESVDVNTLSDRMTSVLNSLGNEYYLDKQLVMKKQI